MTKAISLLLLVVVCTVAYVQSASLLSPSGAAAAISKAKKTVSTGQQKRDDEDEKESSDENQLEDFIQLLSPDKLKQLKSRTAVAASTSQQAALKKMKKQRLNEGDQYEDELNELQQLLTPERRRTSDHVAKQVARASQPKAAVNTKKGLGVKWFGDDDDDTLEESGQDSSNDVSEDKDDGDDEDFDDDDRRRRGGAAVALQDRDYGGLFGGLGNIGKRRKSAQVQVQRRAVAGARISRFLESIGLGNSNPYATSYDYNHNTWDNDDN